MDANADFYFVFCERETVLSSSWNSARGDRHAHRADVPDDIFGTRFDFGEGGALFGTRSCNLMDKDRSSDATSARRIEAVLDGDIVVDDDVVGVDAFILRHINRHFEVQDIARIILDDCEDSRLRGDGLDSFINLVGCRRGKYGSCHGAVEHAAADVAAMRRLVTAATARDERDLAFLFRSAHDDVSFVELPELFRCCLGEAFNHLALDIIHLVDELFHRCTAFLSCHPILRSRYGSYRSSLKRTVIE